MVRLKRNLKEWYSIEHHALIANTFWKSQIVPLDEIHL